MLDRIECENGDRTADDLSDPRRALDQLHVDVDRMGMRVDQCLGHMRNSLRDDPAPAATLRADHEIDAVNASLTGRRYALLGQVGAASGHRVVGSAPGVIAELHRVGHLALGLIDLDRYIGRLTIEVRRLHEPEAERSAVGAFVARAFDRIADHSATIGRRVQQQLRADDPAHLVSAIVCGSP